MSDYQDSCPRLDPSRLLQMLESEDSNQQQQALLIACPCRNRYYDKDIWRAVCVIRTTTEDPVTLDRARHMMGTLRDRARFDLRSVELLRWMDEQGFGNYSAEWLQKAIEESQTSGRSLRLPKVILRDVPMLIEALAADDPDEQNMVLQVLCPGRTRPYQKKVWLAFFQACHSADTTMRSQARVATPRLLEYAKSDPHAQATLHWLYHELCRLVADNPPDMIDELMQMTHRPILRSERTSRFRREDPALLGTVVVEVDPLLEAVYASQGARALRKALYAVGQTGDPRALAVLEEYVSHPEASIGKLAQSLLATHTPSCEAVSTI